jgi:large subunit ribosomal protein L4e
MTPERAPAEGPPAAPAGPHHRAHLLGLDGKPRSQLALPLAFSVPLRPDLIRRAVVAQQSHRIQPHATSPTAGARHSVEWSGKGRGVARTPRLMGSMRGAQAPNTVGGRPAHPPSTETIWAKKVNRTERRLAFASALAATREAKLATERGHLLPHGVALPFVLDDPVEEVRSAKDARSLLEQLKLWPDVRRAQTSTHLHNSGRARRRGRVRRTPRSLLVVTSLAGKALGFRNLAGVDVVPVGRLSTEDLAPGGVAGRLTLFSKAAVEGLRARLGEAAA